MMYDSSLIITVVTRRLNMQKTLLGERLMCQLLCNFVRVLCDNAANACRRPCICYLSSGPIRFYVKVKVSLSLELLKDTDIKARSK